MSKELYFEDKKVIDTEPGIVEGTTRVKTENGAFDVPTWEAEATLTASPSDATDGRNNRANVVAKEILELLKAKNVKVEEVGFYLKKVLLSMEMNEDFAIAAAFGKESRSDVRLEDWESHLKTKKYYENSDLSSEQPSGA